MAKQTPVEAAYQRPGEKTSDGWGRCASIGLFIVLALFLMSLSGDAKSSVDKLDVDQVRSGQARLPTRAMNRTANHAVNDAPHHHAGGIGDTDDAGPTFGGNSGVRGKESEEDMSEWVDVTIEDLRKAEKDELQKEKNILSSALSAMQSGIRSGLAAMLGKSSDDQEVKDIAQEVETRLSDAVNEELDEKGDDIEKTIEEEIEMKVDLEVDDGVDMREIEQDVQIHEAENTQEVRSEIDQAADEIAQNLQLKAAMLEKDIMEKRLSAKLGRPIKLKIVEDRLEGVEEALASQNLPPANSGG